MTDDVRPLMTDAEVRRALADMRATAQEEEDFARTSVRSVDLSLEDVEAIRSAYLWLARLYQPLWKMSKEPDSFGEFGGRQMRRKLPLHRLYAIDERWQARADAGGPMRDMDRALLGPQGSDGV